MGRPKKDIDWEQLDKLCALHCTAQECASFLGISVDTLENKLRDQFKTTFSEYFRQKSAAGKTSLRRRQFEMAQTTPSLAIWLGKQWLGQTDKQEIKQEVTGNQTVSLDQSTILGLVKATMKKG